ncbi:MAG: GNAT family N-acetyltransferase [Saprospiraceae bacterium]|jgi:RimJ/RimL family protein N-acetyltransferase|nr:GNAT family N-acetyltransferase [Saprospiraceae bacterium]
MEANLTVREIQSTDIPLISDYWLNADPDFLHGMGIDPAKLPTREEWAQMLAAQLTADYPDKKAYAIILEVDGQPIGHCNVNPITYGTEAYMHLHIWHEANRGKGHGLELVGLAIPFFFKNLRLERLLCQPYALNPAPNRTLPKLGFVFLNKYTTIPGAICFEQDVNLLALEKGDV